MNVLVTGGAGYIGSHVVAKLLEGGHKVFVIDTFDRWPRMKFDTYNYSWYKHNIVDIDRFFVQQNIDMNIDVIIHLAALKSVADSMRDTHAYFRNNIHGTAAVLEFARVQGVKNIVFASSCAVYGEPLSQDNVYEHLPHKLNPKSVYGWTKKVCEEMIMIHSKQHNKRYAILRLFNVAGVGNIIDTPDPYLSTLMPCVFSYAMQGTPIQVYSASGSKNHTCARDYVHVNDVSNAFVKSCNYLTDSVGFSTTVNICSGNATSTLDVVRSIENALDKKCMVDICGSRPGDVANIAGNNGEAKAVLDWQPKESDIDTIAQSLVRLYK